MASISSRAIWIDSYKGLLIVFVVLGHFLLPLHKSNAVISCIYELIYLFHMPAFIFVSGVLSKSVFRDSRLDVGRILTYFLLSIIFNCLLRLSDGGSLTFDNMFQMSSAPWYLSSLASWMMLVPFFTRLRPAVGVFISVVVSIVCSVQNVQTDFMALSRTGHFLPYFVAGYYVTIQQLDSMRRRCKTPLILVWIIAIMLYFVYRVQVSNLLFFVYGNEGCSLRLLMAVPAYLAISALGICLGLGFLAMSTNRRSILSFLGGKTFQIYVFHRFARGWLSRTGFYAFQTGTFSGTVSALAFLVMIGSVVIAVSCLPIVTKASKALMSLGWSRVEEEV